MFARKNSESTLKPEDTLLSKFSTKSSYAESYRTLRTNLHFSMMDKELRCIVVTSAVQGEGKSNTVANLAHAMAKSGKSVLMVDADLRKPGLSKRFLTSSKNGLSHLVSDVLGKHLNKGNITDYGLKDLIKLCSLQRRTCVMDIADLENSASLYFLKGELVDIFWQNRSESKKLANTLVREKILTKDEATLALGHQKNSSRRLGAILLTMGFVTEKDLERILSVHMMEAFRITTTMLEGTFFLKSLAEDDVEPATNRTINFESLYKEFLAGEHEKSFIKESVDQAIIGTEQENLYLLPSGSIPPNPSELIGSVRTSYLLKVLKKNFDIIIIDTSPVMPASDALLLAPQTDGAILVVKAGGVNKKIIQDTVHQLQNSHANILGVTLNQADRSKDGYYKYYKDYYGS